MEWADWDDPGAFAMVLNSTQDAPETLAILFNASGSTVEFELPPSLSPGGWTVAFSSLPDGAAGPDGNICSLPEKSVVCLLSAS